MLCKKCRKELPEGAVYCCFCGCKQENSRRKRRGNGLGSVYKRGDSWVAEVTLGYYMQGGKQKRKMKRKCGFRTKKDAVMYIESLKAQKEAPKTITFSELWEQYQKEWELSQSKQCAYRIAWNKVQAEIGYQAVDSFSVPDLQELIDEAAPSYYTRKDIKTVLSKLYQIALRDDLTDKNRAEYIKLPKHRSAERMTFSEDDIQKVWNCFLSESSEIMAAVLIMLYTGMRPGEVKLLTANNICLSEHYLTGGIKTEKGRNRKIIIPDKLFPVFKTLPQVGRLFPYGKNWLHEQWEVKRAELGFPAELTLYCCRHTYITRLTTLGVSPAMLKELAGHEDYETTLIYTHLSVEDRLKEVNRL